MGPSVGEPALDARDYEFSVVVPVFNSEAVVGTTIQQIVETFDRAGLRLQLVLVNDGSRDDSWRVISEAALRHPQVVALNLLRNYGQHHANLAGFREATGDWVITMDDDLQNPPDQAMILVEKAMEGFDVVFGRFEHKQAPAHRRWGTKVVESMNRRIFGKPPDLVVSNFRILRRDVVDRICASRTAHPYITGQALMYSSRRANVLVRHAPRGAGTSSYTIGRIVRLVLTILFSYSLFPLRLAAAFGFVVATLSLLLGGFYLVRAMFVEARVPGWTTIAVLLSVFNGLTIALLSMLGEYVVRTLNAVSSHEPYHVVERVEGAAGDR